MSTSLSISLAFHALTDPRNFVIINYFVVYLVYLLLVLLREQVVFLQQIIYLLR
jgi:hypothetical protein